MSNFSKDWELLSFLTDDYEKGYVQYINDSHQYFVVIMQKYPISSYRINWNDIQHISFHISEKYPLSKHEIKKNIECIFNENGINEQENIYVLFDGYIEGCLYMTVREFYTHCTELLTFPQHTYVIPKDASWCLNYTMEHDLFFGYAQIKDE